MMKLHIHLPFLSVLYVYLKRNNKTRPRMLIERYDNERKVSAICNKRFALIINPFSLLIH